MQVRPGEARERGGDIIAQDWKAIGIDGQMEVLSDALLRDAEARATYPGHAVNQNPMGGLSAIRRFATDQIPATANRWAGTNRGAFSSPAWDDVGLRSCAQPSTTIRRLQLERELLRVFHAEVASHGDAVRASGSASARNQGTGADHRHGPYGQHHAHVERPRVGHAAVDRSAGLTISLEVIGHVDHHCVGTEEKLEFEPDRRLIVEEELPEMTRNKLW